MAYGARYVLIEANARIAWRQQRPAYRAIPVTALTHKLTFILFVADSQGPSPQTRTWYCESALAGPPCLQSWSCCEALPSEELPSMATARGGPTAIILIKLK